MTEKARPKNVHIKASDVCGVTQIAAEATVKVARVTEGVHRAVLASVSDSAESPSVIGGVTGLVYQSVRAVAELLGTAVGSLWKTLEPLLENTDETSSRQREAVLAAINGAMGDRLVASANPLATPMTIRYMGQVVDRDLGISDEVGRSLVIFIHGLCMNDLQWNHSQEGQTDGYDQLLASLGQTPLFLRYNTGLHISQNGRQLAEHLESLLDHWPLGVEEVNVVAHSMGGLVIRSACHFAQQRSMRWPQRLERLVFLGTPHQGAPLEQVGEWVDAVLSSTAFSAPFVALTQGRSAGITDLRYAYLTDEDWLGADRFKGRQTQPRMVPLPENADCYALAATTSSEPPDPFGPSNGDGLVPVWSALGRHRDDRRQLTFTDQWVATATSHLELLRSPAVARQLKTWFDGY